ncbi:uncharacterized protein J7T54_003351 [Emericellopsis cladophorae]|uniref:Glutamine amidotransferase type-2 domain-containing protein n=1 Tax=Emericellopsis cladophorae TaxID=2686198 RepID=A0A9P9XV23_9HYPO|nr:uncharacterized protein J7T54_003351 [Emericellopsis cladophorae]KAI6778344.1 hypothetical protein J7T54_003351 [Emericellopsis cladophorae]
MCGITACILLGGASTNNHTNTSFSENAILEPQLNGGTLEKLEAELKGSIEAIAHRGPDESGIWISENEQVGLAHCRLSINDLSSAGRQPLHCNGEEIHAVVNGEIYDYDLLRAECEANYGYAFQSDSDSELVLALYKIHGAPEFFTYLRGEFTFILYDSREGGRRVICARDRFGIKPLVYTKVGSRLLVASEAKAFLPLGWKPRWDVRAIASAAWMFDDRTLFRHVRKVLPGHYLDITEEGGVQQIKYWDAEYEDKAVDTRTVDEMVFGVRERLVESVRLRLRADVPIGIFLSGGIDSSAIAGIVTQLARKDKVKVGNEQTSRVTCFSVAFPKSSGYDESDIAQRTVEWLGVDMVKKSVTENNLAEDFEEAVFHCEHHHFDLNFVAKFALSTLPREHGIKVVLTGEGADEHFAGYPYFASEFLREADEAMAHYHLSQEGQLRQKLFKSAQREMKEIWQRGGATVYVERPSIASIAGVGAVDMSDNLLAWHPASRVFHPWLRDKQGNDDCRRTVLGSHATNVQAKMKLRWHPLHTAMYMWNKSSLPNILLSCLGDRTEMAHSVEARTPFLDHHLAEYVNRLPPSVKLRYSDDAASAAADLGPIWTKSSVALQSLDEKWILRQAMRPFITDELYQRKKNPFLAPTRWKVGGPLHQKLTMLLSEKAVEELGFVDWATIQEDMGTAWGEEADPGAFRRLLCCSAWVALSRRMGVAKGTEADWEGTLQC